MTKHTSFHNTIGATGRQLSMLNTNCRSQEEYILKFFQSYPDRLFTPFEVQKALDMYWVPLTSIRRAITNLTYQDKLEKTKEMKPGYYKLPNHTWRLKIQPA